MKKKLLILLAPIALFLTCNKNVIDNHDPENIALDKTGETFMHYLKTSPNWEKEWAEVKNKGIPLANNARLNYITEHGIHYLLPILSPDKSIHSFTIFPFKQVTSNSNINFILERPIIYSEQNTESKSSLKNLIDGNIYEELTSDGYIVDPNFKPENYQECTSRTSSLYNKQYKFYYKRDGKLYSPWTENKTFLVQVFEVCKRICSTWTTKYIIIVGENSITIRFIDIKDIPNHVFDEQVLLYMSEIERSVKEVYVVPDKKQYILENVPVTDPTLTPGVYVKDFSGTNPIGRYLPTSPPSIPIPLEPSDPCESMFLKMRNAEFKEELVSLKNLTKKGYETTSQFTYNSNGKYTFTRQDGIPGDAEVMMEVRTPIDGFIHTHYTHTLPTFSFDDLLVPYKLVQLHKIKNPKTFSMGLVTRYSTTFIFFDVQQYLAWARFCMQNPISAKKLFKSYLDIDKKMNSSEAIERLAKFLQQNHTGIILMEMGSNNQFKRIEIGSNGNVLRKKCNN